MTIQELNVNLTDELKGFIRERDHIISGDLLNSIRFKCSYYKGVLRLKFDAMFYIKYLEDGEFVGEFFERSNTRTYIRDFIAARSREDIMTDIEQNDLFK